MKIAFIREISPNQPGSFLHYRREWVKICYMQIDKQILHERYIIFFLNIYNVNVSHWNVNEMKFHSFIHVSI